MRVLTTPWKSELLELVSSSKKSIKITSPYIKENICKDLFSVKKINSSFELITSFKLNSIHSGSIDISAIERIINSSGTVKNFPHLHSKIYLFDDKKVIITSGNLTNGGLLNNYEYGIYSDDETLVSQVVSDFSLLSKNVITGTIKKSHIDIVKEILSKVPKPETIKLPKFKIETPEENYDIIEIPNSSITTSLKGWKLDVFNCLNTLPQLDFSLNEIYKFEKALKKIHPENNNIKDKIRQQLQNLRDLGLVEFLGSGHYKKLWK